MLHDKKKQQEELARIRKEIGYTLNKSRLKDDMGRYRTGSLFYELSYSNPDYAIFTVNQDDHTKGYLSFHRLIVLLNDPSEYITAMVLFDSWDHWLRLKESPTISEMINFAKAEMEVRDYSEAIRAIRTIADDYNHKQSFAAAKYLASKEHRDFRDDMKRIKDKRGRGRPRKDLSSELDNVTKLRKVKAQNDYNRIEELLKSNSTDEA